MSEDSQVEEVLEPDSQPEGVPSPPALNIKAPKGLTDADVAAFAKASGLSVLRAQNLRECKAVGDFVDQHGAVAIGRGILLETQQYLREVLPEVVRSVKNQPGRREDQSEADVAISLYKCTADIASELRGCADSLIASEKIAREAKAAGPQPSPFARGTPMVPIQAQNVTINTAPAEKNDK